MRFDKILDFLFHRFAGIMISAVITAVTVFTLSGCFTYDCSVWMCRTITCNENACQGCLEDSIQCDNEQYIRQERNRFGLNHWKKRFMTDEQIERTYAELDCYYSETGCEIEENCGYIVCGGTNLSCWNTICEGGLCINSTKLYSGNQSCTCLNCTIYCDGKPESDDYIPDDHGKSCAGCDNGPYKPKDYDTSLYHPYYTVGITDMKNGCAAQKELDGFGTNYGTIHLLESGTETTTFATVMIYDATEKVPTPEREGYVFRGYYTEQYGRGTRLTESDGTVLDKAKLVSAGKSGVYAHFIPKQNGAKFMTQIEVDFNGSITQHTITEGEDLEALINNIYPLDYNNRRISVVVTYNGNSTEIAVTGGFKNEYRIYDAKQYGIELYGDLMFIKVTEADLIHKVTLNVFDASAENEFMHETPLSVIPTEPVEGYRFLGWSVKEDSIPDILPMDTLIEESMTLFAVYRKIITFSFVSSDATPPHFTAYDGEIIVLPNGAGVPDGMRFCGWYADEGKLADGTTMSKSDAFSGTVQITKAFDGITFVPVWDSNSYNVSYYVNGEIFSADTYNYGEGLILPDSITVDFYTFAGWTSVEGGTVAVTEIGEDEFGDKSFFAILEPIAYTVSLNSSNGILMNPTVTLIYGSAAGSYSLEVPERLGYQFVGWYVVKNGIRVYVTDRFGSSVVDFNAENLGVSNESELSEVKFIADWDVITYTVRFFMNGELLNTETVEHGKTVKDFATPTIPGYDFISWMCLGSPFDISTPITSDTDLSAMVKPRSFKLKLKIPETEGYFAWSGTDGESPFGSETYQANVIFGDTLELSEVEAYSLNGKTFAGWSYNGVTVIDAEGNIVNVELLASIPTDANGYIELVAAWK